MKYVIWSDEDGLRHRSLLRDNDPDSAAPQGIPADPPDVTRLDCDGLLAELHNALVDRGLFTWADVQRAGDGLTGAVLSVFRRATIELYRLEDDNNGD